MKRKMIIIILIVVLTIMCVTFCFMFFDLTQNKVNTCNCPKIEKESTFRCTKSFPQEDGGTLQYILFMKVNSKGVITKNIHQHQWQYTDKEAYELKKRNDQFTEDTWNDTELTLTIVREVELEDDQESIYYYTEQQLIENGYECSNLS